MIWIIIVGVIALLTVTLIFSARANLKKKAQEAQLCLEELNRQAGVDEVIPTQFSVNWKRIPQFFFGSFARNPLVRFKIVLLFIRLRAIVRLFRQEKVRQTPAAAAALASISSLASRIGSLRGMKEEAETNCDVASAGLQALRLYFAHTEDSEFSQSRFDSCFRVNNAFNGSFHKYRTQDGRHFSFHVYYQHQKEKMVKALSMKKDAKDFTMESAKKDIPVLAQTVQNLEGEQLEELAFSCGASGCMLRSREEWHTMDVGRAIQDMPLIRTEKQSSSAPRTNPLHQNQRGPLAGIRVLDLTHIIAGPACSRQLAEYGADVLLVRRKDFRSQEQAFLELDGWAGKRAIDLDFNRPNDLARAKQLIREADVVVNSYQTGALDKFGLSEADIRSMNPQVIFGTQMCFSDTVWKDRPGWAPLAEDITGLSIRNGSLEKPVNLNGVPLDYIPGFILTVGVLEALRRSFEEGGGYTVRVSLARTAEWLHECTDLVEQNTHSHHQKVAHQNSPQWHSLWEKAENTASGTVYFPQSAVANPVIPRKTNRLQFTDGVDDWAHPLSVEEKDKEKIPTM